MLLLNPVPTRAEEQVEKLPVPLNCGNIPEFKFLVDRAESHLRTEEIRKRKELSKVSGEVRLTYPQEITQTLQSIARSQVDRASHDSLVEQINVDLKQLQNYSQAMEKAKDLWRDQVQSHKRNRRLQGRGELFEHVV